MAIQLVDICEECRNIIGDIPILTIPVLANLKCEICGEKAVHVVEKHDLLRFMFKTIITRSILQNRLNEELILFGEDEFRKKYARFLK